MFLVFLGNICHVFILLKKKVFEVQSFQNFNELWVMPDAGTRIICESTQKNFETHFFFLAHQIELPGVTFYFVHTQTRK